MIISIIAAIGQHNVIGIDNQLPWHLPKDLAHFKKLTLNKTVIMGRKTYESIGHILPNRENIIVTRQLDLQVNQAKIAHSLREAINMSSSDEAFIIGGKKIYSEAMPLADYLYITQVSCDKKGDAFFPSINAEEWEEIQKEYHDADQHNPYDYCFVTLKRRKSSNLKADKR